MGMENMGWSAVFSIALSILSCVAPCTGTFDRGAVVSSSSLFLSVEGDGGEPFPPGHQTTVTFSDRQLRKKRIVGGDRVVKGEYPFLALTKGRDVCGATLIHPDILLTAGHCKDYFGDGVTIGGILLDGTDGEFHAVDKVLKHQDYPGTGSEPHDIALVKLSTKSSIQPAKIALWPEMPAVNGYVTAIGFGDVADGGPLSDYAQKVSLRVPDFAACHARYPGKVLEQYMFCTDTPNYDKDTCQGDSGGPLVNGNGFVVGIVSFGAGCAEYGSPSVNTRVSGYIQWITEGICAMSNEKPDECSSPVSLPKQPSVVRRPPPTKSPVRPPTNSPVQAPTKKPVESPTRWPVQSPTNSPVQAPTKKPVESPTRWPVQSPTNSPVKTPTKKPVRPLTMWPVQSPTKLPVQSTAKSAVQSLTKWPVQSPTKSPIRTPTKAPVHSSTKSPNRSPSKSPVQSPIKSPSGLPTKSPVRSTTKSPVQAPTHRPVQAPTKWPAQAPTNSPMGSLTKWPVRAPTKSPLLAVESLTMLPVKSPPQTSVPTPEKRPTNTPISLPIIEATDASSQTTTPDGMQALEEKDSAHQSNVTIAEPLSPMNDRSESSVPILPIEKDADSSNWQPPSPASRSELAKAFGLSCLPMLLLHFALAL